MASQHSLFAVLPIISKYTDILVVSKCSHITCIDTHYSIIVAAEFLLHVQASLVPCIVHQAELYIFMKDMFFCPYYSHVVYDLQQKKFLHIIL